MFSKSRFWFLVFEILCIQSVTTAVPGKSDFNVTKFTAGTSCYLQDRLHANCSQLQDGKYRSVLECAVRCGQGCQGVSVDRNESCYIHKECPHQVAPCKENDQQFNIYNKEIPCFHEGIFNESSQTCQCVKGWVGFRCERHPTSCQELITFGYAFPETFWVEIKARNESKPFRVLCSLYKGFVTSRLMQNKGSLQPNRTWHDYVHGFYVDEDNFWIGLEKMRQLNTVKILCLDVQFGLESSGYNQFSYRYNNFQVENESLGYSFSFNRSGSTGSGLEYTKYSSKHINCLYSFAGVRFSTSDNDNDEDDQQNCAALTGKGWWYRNCTMVCDLLGPKDKWLSITEIDLNKAVYAESLMYFTTA